MKNFPRLPTLLLALNWLLLAITFALTCKAQGNVLWWLRLDWTGWLSALGAMVQLTDIPAGSVWILWVLASAGFTLALALRPGAVTAPVAAPAESAGSARRHLSSPGNMMDSRPELKEKILKLHQSLDRL